MASPRERRPRAAGGGAGRRAAAATCVCCGARRVAGEDGGRGEGGECVRWVCKGVGACVRACAVCVCAPGEAVEAPAPWLGAGRGGIARFSPAGAGDLQAIPLYFRRELTSPGPPPRETPLTAAPSPPVSRRGPSSVIPPPPASRHKLAK